MARFPLPHRNGRSAIAALPVSAGLLAALGVAAAVVVLPDWRVEPLVEASGLPRLLPAAQPPLGSTARVLLAAVLGLVAGAVSWSALFLLVGPGGLIAPRPRGENDPPIVRRADAHPDAPPRRPLSAAELGTPPAPPQEQPLPADLEQPLAAFDPHAIPDVPREPVRALRAIAPSPPAEEPAERIETFDPTPMMRGVPRPIARDPAPTIEALLQRLERGTRRPARS